MFRPPIGDRVKHYYISIDTIPGGSNSDVINCEIKNNEQHAVQYSAVFPGDPVVPQSCIESSPPGQLSNNSTLCVVLSILSDILTHVSMGNIL